MREIKFRAWQPHKSLHRDIGMYQVTGIEFYKEHGGGEVWLSNDGGQADSSEFFEDIKLMQYVEEGIYVGDLVEALVVYGMHGAQFGGKRLRFEVVDDRDGFKFKRVGRLQFFTPTMIKERKIIGNIYEHRHLLNDAGSSKNR